MLEYDHKSKIMHSRFKSNRETEKFKLGYESTIIIEIKSPSKITKVYMLPFCRGEEEPLVSRAIH